MALTVETGAIVAGADSYIDVTAADLYHSNRGNTSWGLLATPAKEAALRKATSFIDGSYRLRWKGRRVKPVTQPLEFPRGGIEAGSGAGSSGSYFYDTGLYGDIFYPDNVIPQRLKDAVCEAAFLTLSGDLSGTTTSGIVREKIGEIEMEYSKAGNSGAPKYNTLDFLLSDFLVASMSATLVRG
jgi:hypothetical protein